MVRKKIILFLMSLCLLDAFAQDRLSFQQRRTLESNVSRVLNSFEKNLNLENSTGNDMNKLNELEELFDENSMISNFLDRSQPKSVQLPAKTFIEYIRENYTSGLSAELTWDNHKINIVEVEDVSLGTIFIPVEITALGIHRSQQILNITEIYFFVFQFKLSDAEISGFSISSIQPNRPPRMRKTNSSLGFGISPFNSYIYSKDIFTSSDWDASGKFGYHIGLQYYYRINNHFSLLTGIGYSHYQSEYILNDFDNRNDPSILRTDIDGDKYYALYSQTNIDEWNGLSFIDIPVGVNYISNEKGPSFYLQGGINLSFLTSSFFDAKGTATIEGYYPDYHVVLSGSELPAEYGFSTNQVDTTGDWNLNQFKLSAYISLGIQIPAGDKFMIDIGPYFTTGLTDLVYNKEKYRDDFFNISGEPGKLYTRGFGFRFELIIKL